MIFSSFDIPCASALSSFLFASLKRAKALFERCCADGNPVELEDCLKDGKKKRTSAKETLPFLGQGDDGRRRRLNSAACIGPFGKTVSRENSLPREKDRF